MEVLAFFVCAAIIFWCGFTAGRHSELLRQIRAQEDYEDWWGEFQGRTWATPSSPAYVTYSAGTASTHTTQDGE